MWLRDRENLRPVHLLAGITANERMDWLVEKATELGVTSITPLLAERSVLKLKGERGDKKRAHWQAVAVAACEQCGRNRVPVIHEAVSAGAVAAASASTGPARGAFLGGRHPAAAASAGARRGCAAGVLSVQPGRRLDGRRRGAGTGEWLCAGDLGATHLACRNGSFGSAGAVHFVGQGAVFDLWSAVLQPINISSHCTRKTRGFDFSDSVQNHVTKYYK